MNRRLHFLLIILATSSTQACASGAEHGVKYEIDNVKVADSGDVEFSLHNLTSKVLCVSSYNIGQNIEVSNIKPRFGPSNAQAIVALQSIENDNEVEKYAVEPSASIKSNFNIYEKFNFPTAGGYGFYLVIPLVPCDKEMYLSMTSAQVDAFGYSYLQDKGVVWAKSEIFVVEVGRDMVGIEEKD